MFRNKHTLAKIRQLGCLNVQESKHIVQDYSCHQGSNLVQSSGFFLSKIPIFLLVFPFENTKTTIMDTKYTFISAFEAFVTQKTEENPHPVQSAGKHMLTIY